MAISHSPVARVRDGVDEATSHWLGWTFPPVERAFAEQDWVPDARSVYCGRCGDGVGEGEATAYGCATCRNGGELEGGVGDGVVRLGAYVNPLRAWVQAVKYQRWEQMASALGSRLARSLREAEIASCEEAIILPMPMPWQRRFYRGIDHAAQLASAMGAALRIPVERVLKRANHPPQVSLTPSERKRAGARGMSLRRAWRNVSLVGATVILVDDVRTTGSTLRAATRLIRRLKPEKVVCCVIAVSDARARRDRSEQHGRPLAMADQGGAAGVS